jgi:hypothetical protein
LQWAQSFTIKHVQTILVTKSSAAASKPNDAPYKKGAKYTGKEHVWDEAFGYWGAAAHTLTLEPKREL